MTSPRTRFQVLARDGFRCQYCGAASTDEGVRLEVDHVYPQSLGGTDDMTNLVTACYTCNRGKAAMVIGPRPEPIVAPPVEPVVQPQPVKPLRRVLWSEEVFTPDQLAVIARVQRRGKAA